MAMVIATTRTCLGCHKNYSVGCCPDEDEGCPSCGDKSWEPASNLDERTTDSSSSEEEEAPEDRNWDGVPYAEPFEFPTD